MRLILNWDIEDFRFRYGGLGASIFSTLNLKLHVLTSRSRILSPTADTAIASYKKGEWDLGGFVCVFSRFLTLTLINTPPSLNLGCAIAHKYISSHDTLA